MAKCCFVEHAPDLCKLGSSPDVLIKKFIRYAQDELKTATLGADSIHHIVYCDMTKLGRPSQLEVSNMATYVKWALELNPSKSCAIVVAPLLSSATVVGGLRGEFRSLAQ